MQQLFDNRKYSARDFEEWKEKGTLFLQPKFQRREVWSESAKAYLIDTILRGKPIPKIFMRFHINPATRTTTREVVDGQQRIRAILDFLSDGLNVRRAHNKELGGKYFSDLDVERQKDFLAYEFSVDLLHDTSDAEIYDIFARLNTYAMKLTDQELRNANWHGEFKSMVYSLSNAFSNFWTVHAIFTARNMLRMAECEFTSELLIAMMEGISERTKPKIDAFYRDHDAEGAVPNREDLEEVFATTMDTIGAIFGDTLSESGFRATRLFYPLFCAVYHCIKGMEGVTEARPNLREARYPRIRLELEKVDTLISQVKESIGGQAEALGAISNQERAFYQAYNEHWVHAEERKTLFKFILKRIAQGSQ